MSDQDWSDFTEAAFRRLVEALQAGGYRFIRYGEAAEGRQVLWRHDVDFSIHRATALAAIEAQFGVTATYFFNPRSTGYNMAEPAVIDRARAIADAGHEIGLHFDAEVYGFSGWTLHKLKDALAREQQLLELLMDRPVRVVSWHNPTLTNLMEFLDDDIGGLVNAYGSSFRRDYIYASDSNGHWRHTPIAQVIAQGHERLHILTHPEWWAPEALSPGQRIRRCVNGRAEATVLAYEDAMIRDARPGVE